MAGRIRIGEILLKAGVIDQHQLNAALGEQRRWGRPLGATLVKMGAVDERSLVRALASQLSLPVASLEGKRIGPDVLELVPVELAERHMVLPLFVKKADHRTTLYLAMEDPGDLAVLDDLAFRTGLQVKPVMMAPSELCEGIDRYYRSSAPAAAPPQPKAGADARPPAALGDVALEALQQETGSSTDAASVQPASRRGDGPRTQAPEPTMADRAAPTAGAESMSGGTAELVAHFKSGGDGEAAACASGSTKPPVAAVGHEALHPSFDETFLAAPPPRTTPSGEAVAAHPPVESLASYEAKTRTILHVLTQLLIEKGVISRDEFHSRVSALSGVDHEHLQDID